MSGRGRLEEIRCLDCDTKFIWVYGTPEYCGICTNTINVLNDINDRTRFTNVTGSSPEELLCKFFPVEAWSKFLVTHLHPRLTLRDTALLNTAWRLLDPGKISDWGAIARTKTLARLTGLVLRYQTEQPEIKARKAS